MLSRSGMTREKVTVTLPGELVRYVERKAAKSKMSRSRIIAEAVAEKKAREEEELAAEGYRFYANEAQQFADSSLQAISEVFGDAS